MVRLKLTPQKRAFFDLYTQASANAVAIARLLVDLMERFPDDRNELIKQIKSREHEGDRLTHDVVDMLNRTFVLERDEEGRIAEAFTPDFYLPDQDLFLEITVMKQRLVTRKNRKLRKLRERYPGVQVKLFYKRDIERLAQRYRLDLAS